MKYAAVLWLNFSVSLCFAQGTTLAAWDFNGLSGNETSVQATSLNMLIDSSILHRGIGLQAASLSNAFQSNQWTSSVSLDDAILNDDYVAFTIRSKSGYAVSLEQLTCNFRRSSTGPDHFQWVYKINDGPLIRVGDPIVYAGTATNGAAQPMISLLAYADLQHIANNTLVEIRLYGYNASGTTGTFALGRLSGNDLELTGSVMSALPITMDLFEAFKKSGYDQLQWRASATDTTDYFYIERSEEGSRFQTIDVVHALIGSHRYQWSSPVTSLSHDRYYRLRMISSEREDRFSVIRRIKGNDLQRISIHPNPTSMLLTISGMQVDKAIQLHIFDRNGQWVKGYSVTPTAYRFDLDVHILQPGLYYIHVPGHAMMSFIKQ